MRTILAAVAALSTTILPAAWSAPVELPHLTEYTMTISMDQGMDQPSFSPPRSAIDNSAYGWSCSTKYTRDDQAETATFAATCLPKLNLIAAEVDRPDLCRPGVEAHIVSLVAGNYVSGTATCGTSGASCTAYAVQPSPPMFHGDCHLDAPTPVPGTHVYCAATWPLVTYQTSWSVSCHDHA